MIQLDLSILNQKGTPMFNSDIFANRPAAGIAGRIFISTDTLAIFRDTGSTWTQLGGGGGGGTINGSIATNQVAFGTSANTIGGTNNLWWDNASTFLGINTNTPNNNLVVNTIVSDGGILIKQNNTTIGEFRRVGTNNYSKLLLINAGVDNIDLNAGGFSYIRQNNFAIGTATDAGYKLDVAGSGRYTDNLLISKNFAGITAISIINTTSNAASASQLDISANTTAGLISVGKYSTLKTAYSIIAASDSFIWNQTAGNIAILNDFATGTIKFAGGGSATAQMTLFSNGNLALNTTTDGGQRLQVIGDTLLRGSGATVATTALTVQNSSSTNLLTIQNNGNLIGSYSINPFYTASNGHLFADKIQNISNTQWIEIVGASNIASTNASVYLGGRGSVSYTSTSGNRSVVEAIVNITPTSGTAVFNNFTIASTINQTGGANGITRGLYVNPTLTLAADWRSIQWDNNTGWGLYGFGTARNYFAGNVQIGSTTAIASNINLQVTGIAHVLDTQTYAGSVIQSFVAQKELTINSAIATGSGICNIVTTGNTILQSSRSVPDTTSLANIYAYNKYRFSSAGLTLTIQQATPGLRTANQLYVQNVFGGTNNGTITHVAGIHISGFYNEAFSTITPIIPNAYQLVINDTGEYGHPFTFTNRWGIYQVGINDRNYLAGNLLLNSTTDTGQILQINGAIRVNGQSSGTAAGNSGQHLIINVDGTQYKIALLNP